MGNNVAKKKKIPEPLAIRRRGLKKLIEEAGSHKAIATRSGIELQYISQMLYTRGISNRSAAKLEDGMSKPRGWLDRHEYTADTPLIPEHHFLEKDLATLKQLIGLPDEVQEPIRELIAGTHKMSRARRTKKATETETAD